MAHVMWTAPMRRTPTAWMLATTLHTPIWSLARCQFHQRFIKFINLLSLWSDQNAWINVVTLKKTFLAAAVKLIHFPETVKHTKCKVIIDEVIYRDQFHQCFMSSFYLHRFQMRKDTQVISVFLRFWDLCMQKAHLKCWWIWLL